MENKQRNEERKARTRRLIERGAILEGVFPLAPRPSRRRGQSISDCPVPSSGGGGIDCKPAKIRGQAISPLFTRAHLYTVAGVVRPCRGLLRTSSAMGSYAPQTPCAPCAAKHPLCVCPAPRSLKYPRLKGGATHRFLCISPSVSSSAAQGRSAVAAAAYRSGTKLTNEWDGMTHDYTRKGGIVHAEIMLPAHAPPEFADRSILWNSVEQIEKARDSQLAREIEAALPRELSGEQQLALVRVPM